MFFSLEYDQKGGATVMTLGLAFKALSDTTRREILHMLQQGDLSAGEIADHFEISKPSISHHLNVLKQANLVQDIRQGQNIYYSLNTTVFQDMLGWFCDILGRDVDDPQRTETQQTPDDFH